MVTSDVQVPGRRGEQGMAEENLDGPQVGPGLQQVGGERIDELDFLCDATVTTYTEIATELDLHRSALTRWRRSGSIPHRLYSSTLKRFFWFKVFGNDLEHSETSLSLSAFRNEDTVLRFMHDQAIAQKFAERMERVAA